MDMLLFYFFMLLQATSLIHLYIYSSRGDFFPLALWVPSPNSAMIRSELAVWSRWWLHVWCWKAELLLHHPSPIKRSEPTESCVTVSSSYLRARSAIPKPFLLRTPLRVDILMLILMPEKHLWRCMHAKTGGEESKNILFCGAQLWMTPEIAPVTLQLQAAVSVTLNMELKVINSFFIIVLQHKTEI